MSNAETGETDNMDAHSANSEAAKPAQNVDQGEIDKFSELASRWWDRQGDFKPLHDINPLRLNFVDTCGLWWWDFQRSSK